MRISIETMVGFFIISAVVVFFYMSYQVGSFRFDRLTYNTYTAYFNDVSGLAKKADVKIAGVKAGWVDRIELVNDGQQVKAVLMLDKSHVLHVDAYAIVRQEGFLGTKHLEIVPGDPLLPVLHSGGMLTRPNRNPATIDDVLQQFSQVTENMRSVFESINKVIGGAEGERALRRVVEGFEDTAQNFASFAQRMDRMLGENEDNIHSILRDLREAIPSLSSNLQKHAGTVAEAIDRDFNRMATQFESGIAPIREAMQKFNDGKGVLGQLLNDEQTSDDIRTAIGGVRSYFDKIDKMKVLFDIHTEAMGGPVEGRALMHENKTYANMRLHTAEDYFYLVGLVSSRNGQVQRFDETRNWYDDSCHELVPADLHLSDNKKLRYARYRKLKVRSLDKLLFNVQFGKIFGNFAFRFGLFDSTGGVGMDIDIPFGVADLRWVTTFEAFDFSGINRYYEDTREDNTPHLKWLNRMFVTRNIYFTFGADDFISRFNKNAFFGIGLRFVDDDIKYLLSRITIMAPT